VAELPALAESVQSEPTRSAALGHLQRVVHDVVPVRYGKEPLQIYPTPSPTRPSSPSAYFPIIHC
jgi:hypothetical protein